jgi:hypothetical protein
MKKSLLLFCLLPTLLFAGNDQIQHQLNQVNKNFFIENKGQWSSEVKYLARAGGMNAWITNSGVVYDYYQIVRNYNASETMKMPRDRKEEFERKNTSVKGHVVKMSLVDVDKECVQEGNNKQGGYYNYFIGNDNSKWASFVGLYGDIAQSEIYKGIDVKYYFDGKSIRYDYIVKPGADLSQLRLKFEGQESMKVNEVGELVIKTSLGEVTNGKLYSYQFNGGNKSEVACKFVQGEDGTVSLDARGYDKNKELIIDPLVYSTFLGGNDDDVCSGLTIDNMGDAYLTGSTSSSSFPTLPGAYQKTYMGNQDIFVTEINPTGSELVFSTFVGGSSIDWGNNIVIDAERNVYISGFTYSLDYPITPGAYQDINGGNQDNFITKFNPTGSSLIYSTYIGGTADEYCNSMAIDITGNIYLVGSTHSSNYPVTPGAYQTNYAGGWGDVFVTKLNPSGNGLVYSTYLGGSDEDEGNSISIDASGNAYVTGTTMSTDYPITSGAFQTKYGGGNSWGGDVFVTKLNPKGNSLVYSTYIGGNREDFGQSLVTDIQGNVYLTGGTLSQNFPTTSGAYKTILPQNEYDNNQDVFVAKLNSAGSSLVYSTYMGGDGNEIGNAITVNKEGDVYLTGTTNSSNYPITPKAYQYTSAGTEDVFVTKLNSAGSNLLYSTYLGGIVDDEGNAIAIDTKENIYLAGYARSSNFPTTPGAYQTIQDWLQDGFVTKLNMSPIYLQLITPNGGEAWISGLSKTISWAQDSVLSIKIEYSTNNGTDWVTIINNYQAILGSYIWQVPSIYSNYSEQCLMKITDLSDSTVFDKSNNVFTIWQPIIVKQTPITGQNSLNFGLTNIILDLYVYTPAEITTTYNQFETPQPGKLPTGIISIKPFYWTISSDSIVSFDNGQIKVLTSSLPMDSYSYYDAVWLKRTNPGDDWTNIGGAIIAGGYLASTTTFNTFSEFAIGTIQYPNQVQAESIPPTKFILEQNYPNPFNPSTVIKYAIPFESRVNIRIYNSLGQCVREVNEGIRQQGYYEMNFNSKGLASGVYFYTIRAISKDGRNDFSAVKKMMLIK